jgi:hypothetical protein
VPKRGIVSLRDASNSARRVVAVDAKPSQKQAGSIEEPMSEPSDDEHRVKLTPEHAELARRIAEVEGKTIEQVVADALTILWVRHATKRRLRHDD